MIIRDATEADAAWCAAIYAPYVTDVRPDVGDEEMMQSITSRLRAAGSALGSTVDGQVALLEQLATFHLDRFLLESHGLNA